MEKKELIDRLIVNEQTQFTEEDRSMLEAQDEKMLALMTPLPVTNAAPKDVKDDEDEDADTEDDKKKKPVTNAQAQVPVVQTLEQVLNSAPVELRDMLKESVATHNAEKKRLVNTIRANERNRFSEDFLNAKSLGELRGIAAIAAPARQTNNDSGNVPMFDGQGELSDTLVSNEEPLLVPTMDFGKK